MAGIPHEGFELTKFLNKKFGKRIGHLETTLKAATVPYSTIPSYKVDQCRAIHNPTLFAAFLLRKKEYEIRGAGTDTRTMLHATPKMNKASILEGNFDYRKCIKQRFGIGVAFTDDFGYAMTHCRISSDMTVFVSEVLIGNTVTRCIPWVETISIDSGVSNNRKVYVKARDDEYYPEYVIDLN